MKYISPFNGWSMVPKNKKYKYCSCFLNKKNRQDRTIEVYVCVCCGLSRCMDCNKIGFYYYNGEDRYDNNIHNITNFIWSVWNYHNHKKGNKDEY